MLCGVACTLHCILCQLCDLSCGLLKPFAQTGTGKKISAFSCSVNFNMGLSILGGNMQVCVLCRHGARFCYYLYIISFTENTPEYDHITHSNFYNEHY